jgi:glucose/arabinose dehydrogenase
LVFWGCDNASDPASTGSTPAAVAAPTPEPAEPAADASVARANDPPMVRLVRVFEAHEFTRPVFLAFPPGQPDRAFVVEQPGRIHTIDLANSPDESSLVLDIEERILRYEKGGGNEEGLLSLAFHPDYAENATFYVHYSAKEPRRGVLASFRTSKDNPTVADPASEEIILEVPQPFGNHNGSTVLFGPKDGFLYMSLGDGGSGGDPLDNGQNLGTLLGSIIRIDVNNREGDLKYAIPEDNPFIKRKGARPEIWAYGLRNVWRMSFDRETGALWAADVGQGLWEEIDIITRGGNYGWDIREGFHPFQGGRSEDPLLDPVHEYNHHAGLSITGGYVYRGSRLKRLIGAYIYGDYATARIWALRVAEDGTVTDKEILIREEGDPSINVGSFSEGPDGELYMLGFDGRIYILEEV